MGVSDPPYLYDGPSNRHVAYPYSDFDPRAASRASWAASQQAARPRPKQEGPLIDFNKHPDSYIIVTGSQGERQPMSPKAKTWIKAMRWVQFAFRVMQLIGAAGTLVCVILIRKAPTAEAWIMRVPPGCDIFILLYSLYHLIRPAKSRTPGSSASYHVFAMIMDGGLIPFYVYTAIVANQDYNQPPDADGIWRSVLSDDWSTSQLILATWLAAVVMAGLHLISIGLDIYLMIMFRKIASLPPDMNPLEDNLTSRRAAKHQYKNSEASASTFSMTQKPGHMSSSTINLNDNRFSKATTDDRAVPFRHSRMGSDLAFSPHNPDTARLSRQQYDEQSMYRQAPSNRGSRQSFVSHARSPSAGPSKRGSYIEDAQLPPMPPVSNRYTEDRPNTFPSTFPSTTNPPPFSSPAPNPALTPATVESQQHQSLLNDNWYVTEDRPVTRGRDSASPGLKTPDRYRSPVPNFSRPSPEPSPEPLRQARLPTLSPELETAAFVPQPLRMNPPTPPLDESQQVPPFEQRRISYHDYAQPRQISLHDVQQISPPRDRQISYHGASQPRQISLHDVQQNPPPQNRQISYHEPSQPRQISLHDAQQTPPPQRRQISYHAPSQPRQISLHDAQQTPPPQHRQTSSHERQISHQNPLPEPRSASYHHHDQETSHDQSNDHDQEPSPAYPASDDEDTAPIPAERQLLTRAPTAASTTAASSIYSDQPDAPLHEGPLNRSLTVTSDSVYSESAPSLQTAKRSRAYQQSPRASPGGVKSAGTPKGRAYGDLGAAMRGIRGQGQPQYQQVSQAPTPPRHGGGGGGGAGRVVSRSGADIADEGLFVLPEKSGRRRFVSGKVAEEGRAGGRW